jgi:Flp pilus assembly protein TadD
MEIVILGSHRFIRIFTLLLVCLFEAGTDAEGRAVPQASNLSAGQNVVDSLASARGLLQQERLAEAEVEARKYLQSHPVSGPAHFLLGLILFREDKAKDSLAEFTDGAKFNTPSAKDLKIVALDYVLIDDYDDAQTWLIESIKKDQSDPVAWYSLGRVQYKLNVFQDAAKSFLQCLQLDPHNVKAEDNLGLTLAALNRTDEAVAAYRQAIAWQADSKHPSEQPLLNLGSILIELNQLDEATRLLKQAVAIAPKDPKIHEALGRAYSSQDDFGNAASHLEQAIALSPNDSRLHFQLAQVYRKLGMTEKAKVEFERTATLSGTHSTPD